MANMDFSKEQMLEAIKYLWKYSDEQHTVTADKISSVLTGNSYGTCKSKPTIYSYVQAVNEVLGDFVEVESVTGRYHSGLHVINRLFDIAELKILVDSVTSSKFISRKKSKELIDKIESLASVYEGAALTRELCLANRQKAPDESVLITVDRLHQAINGGNAIKFVYKEYNLGKTLVPRISPERPDGIYTVTPRTLIWNDENYYLLGYDHMKNRVAHYRVDKISSIEDAEIKKTDTRELWDIDLAGYSKTVFGMFTGKSTRVTLKFDNSLIGAAVDVLGSQIPVIRDGDRHFITSTDVIPSGHFLGWIFALGDKVEILAPDEVRAQMKESISRLSRIYSAS